MLAILGLLAWATGCSNGTHPKNAGRIVHALAPLTGEEIVEAIKVLNESGGVPAGARFTQVALDEPAKESVLSDRQVQRRASAVVYDPATDRTWEAIANLSSHRLDAWKEISRVQPALTREDTDLADTIVRQDVRWRRALAARKITNFDNVRTTVWSAGYFGLPGTGKGRIVRALFFYRADDKNELAHPIEGLVAHVNLSTGTIIDLLDIDRQVPVPNESTGINKPGVQSRQALATLQIRQPKGPGFHFQNGEVRWDKWRLRYALHPREGLVLYLVGYEDGGSLRSILYRGSVSEMVVPYGDPGEGWFFRNALDVGEFGLGVTALSLRPGVDCPDNCSVFDAVLADSRGKPETIPGAIAVFERDGGVAWKHGDDARRSRELVLASFSKVGNYDYGFEWVFHQDGTLEARVILTGIMSVKGVAGHAHEPYSHMVATNTAAVHHQHFFTFRLDMDVDGPAPNRLVEMNNVSGPTDASNRFGNAFGMEETPLQTESEAQRSVNLASGRRWVVINPAKRGAIGQPSGYALIPGENALPLARPDSWVRKRAGFLNAHIWATPYRPAELYAAGDYPNQSQGGDGLVRWTGANRLIDNGDLVLWYTMGVTHNPRPEDWPVMPVHVAGFRLIPWGFFDRNPTLDLPPN